MRNIQYAAGLATVPSSGEEKEEEEESINWGLLSPALGLWASQPSREPLSPG